MPLLTLTSLFTLMQGHWLGEGERIQSVSGRHSKLEVRVDSEMKAEVLVSSNEVIETSDPGSTPRTYRTVYWIREAGKDGETSLYEMGAGDSGQGEVLSRGRLEPGPHFVVEQKLGDYTVKTDSFFPADGATVEYTESLLHGTTELSHTHAVYKRLAVSGDRR